MEIGDKDGVPLQPLNEVIKKFKRRREIMDFLMIISMPSALVGIVLFGVFALISDSAVSILTFILLVISAIASYLAVLYIPGTLTNVIKSLEYTVRGISFTLIAPMGNTPAERIFNQLRRSDQRIKNLIEKNSDVAKLNIKVKGKSGIEHFFDVYLYSEKPYGRFFGNLGSVTIFVKRFDESNPVSLERMKTLKADIQDCISGIGKRFPSRVLAVSTSGFDEPVYGYVRSKEGTFSSRYGPLRCRIELIQEKVDGRFDVMSL